MAICATETEYKEKYDEKVNAEKFVAPFISVIGSLEDPKFFMVDFENMTFKVFDFVRALDICFKAYHVFNMAYPEPCEPLWDFVNQQFYGIDCQKGTTKPEIHALLNDVKCKSVLVYPHTFIYFQLRFVILFSGCRRKNGSTQNSVFDFDALTRNINSLEPKHDFSYILFCTSNLKVSIKLHQLGCIDIWIF